MIEVAEWLVDACYTILVWMRDNPYKGILTFVLMVPVIKLFGKFLKAIINR